MHGNMKTKRLLEKVAGFFRYGVYGLVLFGAAGCTSMPSFSPTSAALQLDIAPRLAPSQIVHPRRPIVLRVAKYSDARSAVPSGKIGDINATVFDMLGTELVMEDLSGTVTAAMANQLGAGGLQTVADSGNPAAGGADFEVSGVIREFSLNIGGRDAVSIVVETTLRDSRAGRILWSGAVAEKADRFAGVAGNTRNSITRYLSDALAKVSAKTRDAISESIMQTYPELFQQAASARQSAPGVTVLVAPPQQAPASQAVGPGTTGRLAIATIPARAKVYVADVYYGLSPLNLELEPGIYTINLKLDGFKTATEKVSVRKGVATELEIRLLGPSMNH
jgi:hypothetical protein